MSFFERPANSILHPTDFSPSSESAFAHALAIALKNQAALRIFHVLDDPNEDVQWDEYPSVRKTLERWGELEPGSRRRDVTNKLGIEVQKLVGVDKNVAKSIAGLTEVEDIDLIVMATNEHRENPFWSTGHISFDVSQRSHLPTLFVPDGTRGCVSLEDGTVELNQVLIAVDHQPDAQPAIERIVWALDKFGGANSHVTLLHIGNEDKFPVVHPPKQGNFQWTTMNRTGNAAKGIVAVAQEINADVIVMVTEGKHGFWNALQGSTTNQVLKHAPCLVFTMPAGEF
jgi:nucleotide-binding universal stress UspA family protein